MYTRPPRRCSAGKERGFNLCKTLLLGVAGLAVITCTPLGAEEIPQENKVRTLLDDVVVTARKRREAAQDVPLSITAYSSEKIDAMKVRNLTDLAVGMPNVALDDIGTSRGIANFSIRGLGVNSSIPSIDPTVGVFVDGIYMGINNGIIFDTFDLASVEVLRGPQGTLFGRNVIGGAILLNTNKPGEYFEAKLRTAVDRGKDGGYNRYLMGNMGGPINDKLAARISVYYNDDEGWFENEFDGHDFGEAEQKMMRPTLVWKPDEYTELTLRYERSEIKGDGPAAQAHTNGAGVPGANVNFSRHRHDFSIDEPGFHDNETDFFSAELNVDVGFGDGTITNIFGWRDFEGRFGSDIDAQPTWLFHVNAWNNAEQFSNELRYNGWLSPRANVTAGVYYFNNEINYHERREFLGVLTGGRRPASTHDGGGDYEVETYGAFATLDYDISDTLTLMTGLRYTYEEKEADIASLIRNINRACNVLDNTCPFDFRDDEDWDSWAPKLGLSYRLSDDAFVYGHWTRGFRSGGYNLRNTSPEHTPEAFDEETIDSFEIGFKSDFEGGRLNGAVFFNQVDDMQRDVNLPSQAAGVVQLVRNTADADIFGVELEGTFNLTENLLLLASVGWLDADYTHVEFDLNGDGNIDGKDKGLDISRAADWTYSIGLNHRITPSGRGYLVSHLNYAFRDESSFSDNNLGVIRRHEMLNAGLDFHSGDGHWVWSLYGKNLLNDVKHGGDTTLPGNISGVALGGTFAPLDKGRYYGVQITYSFL